MKIPQRIQSIFLQLGQEVWLRARAMYPHLRHPLAYYRGLSGNGKKWFWVKVSPFCLFFSFLLLDLLLPLPAPKPYSQVIRAKDGTMLCAYLTPDQKWRLQTHTAEIQPEMITAILAKEDSWFYWHYGVNPVALVRALGQNIFSGKRKSGASTITMQLARMAAPKSRTYGNKLAEIFRAIQYEWHYTKQEILEMYLSYLPYGGNIEGVHSAAYLFFNTPPQKLSLSQCVLLAVIPNRPNSLRLDRVSDAPLAMRDKWLKRFQQDKIFASNEIAAALEEKVSIQRFAIENKTPHLCQMLHSTHKETEIDSYLDLNKQEICQKLLAQHVQRITPFGITNGAVLVVDNQTHKVVAYCGSADFQNVARKGQVNGVTAIRSPGSALKPAVYALGFDMGLITPKMKLPDVPGNFSGYSPDNFDMQFRGYVTVHTALSHSLNLPPVWLLEDVGYNNLIQLLEKAGFSDIRKRKEKLGYSVALGGCGVTLEEITRFYSSFALGGNMHELIYTQKDSLRQAKPVPLFSPATAYLIGSILSDLERPDIPQMYVDATKMPKIAWKTGTSYGKRDAWSIGYSPRYTVGVWMGNMDGKGAPELTGAVIATPLLIDIFNAVDYNPTDKWFVKPEAVDRRTVCAESGMLPGPECTQLTQDLYIRKVSPLKNCDLYKPFYVNESKTMEYCPACKPSEGYITHIYPVYPPEVALWMTQNHIGFDKVPPHNPACTIQSNGSGPKILSPATRNQYYIESNSGQQVLLQAATDAQTHRIHWYINGQYYKTVAPEEKVFYPPTPGRMQVTCVDERGRKSEVIVTIVMY